VLLALQDQNVLILVFIFHIKGIQFKAFINLLPLIWAVAPGSDIHRGVLFFVFDRFLGHHLLFYSHPGLHLLIETLVLSSAFGIFLLYILEAKAHLFGAQHHELVRSLELALEESDLLTLLNLTGGLGLLNE